MTFGVQTFAIRKQQKKDIKQAYLPLIEMGGREFEIARMYSLSIVALVFFGIFGSNLYVAYVCVFFVALGFAGAQLTSWIMFPHTIDAGELLYSKRQSGSCSAIMTFARKSSSALVIFLFSLVLEFTGYDKNLEVQTLAAQNGIKYVMARCYVLSRERNVKIQKL